jgi:hypothetical protein
VSKFGDGTLPLCSHIGDCGMDLILDHSSNIHGGDDRFNNIIVNSVVLVPIDHYFVTAR